MRVLGEIKGQHEWLTARVGDFDATACECGLSDEADFRIDFTELHVLVIAHFEFSNPAAASISVEERRSLRTELGLGAGPQNKTKDGAFLITQKIFSPCGT